MPAVETNIHHLPPERVDPTTLSATITRVGYYRDTLPLLIISIRKEAADCLPYAIGKRIPIPFTLSGETFTAGIRTTLRSPTVMICPDLTDAAGEPIRLVDLLLMHGFVHNGKVDLRLTAGGVELSR